MIKRAVAAFTALFVASFMGLLALAPSANAICTNGNNCQGGGGGGTGEGCNPATAMCFAGAYQFVTLTGDKSTHTTQDLDVPPPPCLWQNIGSPQAAYAIIQAAMYLVQAQGPGVPGAAALMQQLSNDLKLAAKQEGQKPPPKGDWYMEEPNPAVSTAASASCGEPELFFWVVPGAAPPVQRIPGLDLAAYAFDHMVLPKPAVTTSPAATGYVNFATYVWTTWATSAYTGTRARAVTARLGRQSVTVWAQPTVKIQVNGPGTAYTSGCTINGSASPLGKAPASKPGVPPDCGALWTATDAGATITATITWTVTYYNGGPAGPGGNRLAVIGTNGTSPELPINSIQAVN